MPIASDDDANVQQCYRIETTKTRVNNRNVDISTISCVSNKLETFSQT